ncbi:MAG TPA: hypothetical protein VK864_17415, partial [Longimicrobiales bacterium]|nr:hypothetical protein [Longimicrobiales bacterium]
AVSGRGGSVGPDLARSQAVLSPMEAARLMWQHAPSMQQRLQDMRIAWPQLNGAELSDLIAYLSSLPSASELSRSWGK